MRGDLSFRRTVAAVLVFAGAMAYLEAAVVVYLEAALGSHVGDIFPLRPASELGNLIAIEVGREAATLVIIGAVGLLVGRSRLERLAWSTVVFGVWDIGYYAWLFIFSGWPPSLRTFDLLFLLPVPWAGPVWSPITVSATLIGVGLAAASARAQGQAPRRGSATLGSCHRRRASRCALVHDRRAAPDRRRPSRTVCLATVRSRHAARAGGCGRRASGPTTGEIDVDRLKALTPVHSTRARACPRARPG